MQVSSNNIWSSRWQDQTKQDINMLSKVSSAMVKNS